MPEGYTEALEKQQEQDKYKKALEELAVILNARYATTADLLDMVNNARKILRNISA